MKMSTLRTLTVLQLLSLARCFYNPYPKFNFGQPDNGDPGTPLFLTPFVETGNIEEARSLARVPFTDTLRMESYSGFFTVDKNTNANHFFWYFPAMVPDPQFAPVILWLQGGPGITSLYGLFMENGPLKVRNDKIVRRKKNCWANKHHVIYIDNPVGTGFSFTTDPAGYCTNQTQVSEHLYSTLIQFFQLFPELQQNKFFITGESYAGKYISSLAYIIHQMNKEAEIKINLKGIAIGNGLLDPVNQLVYSNYLYQLGLIDWNQAQVFATYETQLSDFIQNEQWDYAYETFDTLLAGDEIGGKSLFHNMTGFNFYYNFLQTDDYLAYKDFGPMLQSSFIRNDIHVGNSIFNTGDEVRMNLKQDFMQSVAPIISELLDHYYVLIYNGQLDIILPYVSNTNFLRKLDFSRSLDYEIADRYPWYVDNKLAGYVKQAGRLIEIMVRSAGHMVPADKGKWALDMITRLTHGKSFFNDRNDLEV